MRLSWAGMEATSMVFPGAAGRCPGGSVIPGITHMFPKQMQWESWGGGAGQALVSEEVPVLILPHPCPQPVFPVSLALLSTKAHLFLKPPPGSLFGFKRQCRTTGHVKPLPQFQQGENNAVPAGQALALPHTPPLTMNSRMPGQAHWPARRRSQSGSDSDCFIF